MRKGFEETLKVADEMLSAVQDAQEEKATTTEITVSADRLKEYERIGSAILQATQKHHSVVAKLEGTSGVPTEMQNSMRQRLKAISERLERIGLGMNEVDNLSDETQYNTLLKVNTLKYH